MRRRLIAMTLTKEMVRDVAIATALIVTFLLAGAA